MGNDEWQIRFVTKVSNPTDLGGGQYSAEVSGLESEGVDRYIIAVDDGIRPVQLTPDPMMTVEVPPGGFEVHPPVPGIAGEVNTVCVSGGTPGATVRFIRGRQRGVVATPCGPIAIRDGVVMGEATVDDNGKACISQAVGENARGIPVRFQAVELPGCDRSNVVVHAFE